MKKYLFALLWLVAQMAQAQEWAALPSDEIFALARKEAFAGERNAARQKLHHVLSANPDYADVRILLARTYAWDARYDSAEHHLKLVLLGQPKNQDALNALADTYIWSEAWENALQTANMALRHYPTFPDFLYKKALSLSETNQPTQAVNTLNELLVIDPTEKRAIELREKLAIAGLRWSTRVSGTLDLFSKNFDPAFTGFAQLSRTNNWGLATLRVNYASRFNLEGIQPEIDLYPTLGKKMYGYLNYGYSQSALFPEHRLGAEVFAGLPAHLEGSLGVRYLHFPNPVTMYTGSIGWYYRKLWMSFRPFITPNKQVGTTTSAAFTLRRYFRSSNSYLQASGGFGFSPEARLQSAAGLSADDIFVLGTQRIGLGFQSELSHRLFVGAMADFTRQETTLAQGDHLYITSLTGYFIYRF